MKIPKNFKGIDGKKAYNKIVNEVKEKSNKPVTQINPIQIQEHDKYDYFFAGINEYNLYKQFVETNFPKTQQTGLQTLEELSKPTLENKLFKASSPIINSALNMALRNQGIQVVTQAQLEYVFQNNLLELSNIYSDTGMCLRTKEGANQEHAKDLIKQLENQELPVYLPIISYDLELDKDNHLKFKIIDKTKIIHIPILNSSGGNFNNEEIDLNKGFPKQLDENGGRSFFTRQDGLSRCCLVRDSILNSDSSDLSYSNDYGRVVLAKPRSGWA